MPLKPLPYFVFQLTADSISPTSPQKSGDSHPVLCLNASQCPIPAFPAPDPHFTQKPDKVVRRATRCSRSLSVGSPFETSTASTLRYIRPRHGGTASKAKTTAFRLYIVTLRKQRRVSFGRLDKSCFSPIWHSNSC